MAEDSEVQHIFILGLFLIYIAHHFFSRYFNRNLRFYILFVFCLTWYIFRHFGASLKIEATQKEASEPMWYVLYVLLATSMGFFILKDWVNDLQDHKRNQMVRNAASIEEGCCFRLARVFISNWVEVVFLAVLILLLLPSPPVLKIVLTTLLVLFVLRELLQITVSVKRSLTSV